MRPFALLLLLSLSACAGSTAFRPDAPSDEQFIACAEFDDYRAGWVMAATFATGGAGAQGVIAAVASAGDGDALATVMGVSGAIVAAFGVLATQLAEHHAKLYGEHGCETMKE